MDDSAQGSWPVRGGVAFRVWAPRAAQVEVELDGGASVRMARGADGYHSCRVRGIGAGARYKYRVDGNGPFPDPASRSQPVGPHGPSEVVDPGRFRWKDQRWAGVDPDALVIYEVHVGTATPAGTFDALIDHLPDIKELGVTALELLPVAECPGRWNWGYDGVSIWAPSSRYGGPEGLRRLVDAAHRHGLAVLLDVVYNHLGPDGNYLRCYADAYFTRAHHTPWGEALDYTQAPVREFFIGNALHWIREYHLDGLRCDATHEIRDPSPTNVLTELAARVRAAAAPRPALLIAEDDRNDRRLVLPRPRGWGFDGVWADDLHHQLQVALVGDRDGYYARYGGTPAALARTLDRGWYFEGQRGPDGRRRGSKSDGLPARAFVHCLQNHDQVGNRALGERLHHLIRPAAWRAASAFLLASPYPPLLFMGQEWAASAPFCYFTDHHDELGRAVTEGRRREFQEFRAFRNARARAKIPDPQSEDTFRRSKLSWEERERPGHAECLLLYREALRLRLGLPAPARTARAFSAGASGRAVWYRRRAGGRDVLVVFNLSGPRTLDLARGPLKAAPGRRWTLTLSSEESRFGGDPRAAALDGAGRRLRVKGAACVILEAD